LIRTPIEPQWIRSVSTLVGQLGVLTLVIVFPQLRPGDFVTIFTPDDTHFDIAMEAVRRGLHVLVTKPAVKARACVVLVSLPDIGCCTQTLAEHIALRDAARAAGVLVAVEMHKRWDPLYADARERIRTLGAAARHATCGLQLTLGV
jgi:hypothetical protein